MASHQLLSTRRQSEDHFMVSALTEDFEKATRIFFGRQVHLEQRSALTPSRGAGRLAGT
jgi:hypothetical protein